MSLDRPLRDVVRHTLVYGLGNVSMALVGLVLVPVYTRHLTVEAYGLLALLLALYGFLGRVYDLGTQNSVGRFYFDRADAEGDGARPGALPRLTATATLFVATWGAALSLALWLGAPSVARMVAGSPDHAGLVRIVALTLLADVVAMVPLTLIRMEERTGWYLAVTTSRFAGALVLNILFVVVLDWGVRGILLSGALTSGAVVIVLTPELVRRARGWPSLPLLREILAFGLPFVPVPLSIWLIDYSDRWLLEVLASREDVGLYALGYKVAQVVQLGVTAFSMGWAPLRYRIHPRPDARDLYRTVTTFYVLGMGLMCVGLGLVDRAIVGLLAPESYAAAAAVVAPLAVAYALYGLFVLMVTGMGVTKSTGPMALIAVVGASANVGLNLLLIPLFGMMAAASTTVLANALLATGAWWFSERVYPIPQDWGVWLKVILGGVAVLAADAAWEVDGFGTGLLKAMLLMGGYVVFLVATGGVQGRHLRAARGLVSDLRP